MKDLKTLVALLQKLKYILPEKRRKQSIGILIIILIGSCLELLGVTSILPFIQVLLTPEKLAENKLIKPVAAFLGIHSVNGLIFAVAGGVIGIYLIKNGFLLFSSYVQIKFRNNLQKQLSTKLLESFMRRPYTFFLNVNSSDIMRGLGSDVDSVNTILDSLFKLCVESFSCIMIGGYILIKDTLMAGGVLFVAAACFMAITLAFKKKTSISGLKQWSAIAVRNKYAYQAITGIKEIMVSHRNDYFVKAYDDASDDVRKISITYNFVCGCPERIIEAVCIVGIIVMVCIRLQLGVNPETFVPQLGAFAVAAFRILPSISRMSGCVNTLVFYRTALESTYNNLKEAEDYEQYVNEYNKEHGAWDKMSNKDVLNFEKELEIRNVSWKYPSTRENVLEGLSVTVHKGESVALIGSSGAGKTTLADVVLGLLRPQQGAIYIDGVDVLTVPEAWSKIVGYVPQTVFMIDDSIKNNVAFGIDKNEIDENKVWAVLEQAQLSEYVKGLPDGIETVVGERGIKFSGGQRQRIAIARALYGDPDILVLDEATSALDNETESSVMEAIDILQGQKTLIIVAHRLTTIQNCDKIYEVKEGKAYLRDKESVLN